MQLVYKKEEGKLCTEKPNVWHFQSLREAMKYCDSDVGCGGMYDNCGEETSYTICNTDITDIPSDCDDIRYTKGKLIPRTKKKNIY